MCDALSVAWEFFESDNAHDRRGTPESIAWYAIRRVASGRHLPESARSITGPNPNRLARPVRTSFDPGAWFRAGDDPSEIVAFRELFRLWFASLNDRQRAVAELLVMGEHTCDVAARCGISAGRVSQIRRELEAWWTVVGA